MVDQTITHYKITEKLGGGRMGVAYKAEDAWLSPQVATEVLPSRFIQDPQQLESRR